MLRAVGIFQGVEEPTDYVLEQYTGLKDKNGKEIYDGDIVSRYNSDLKGVVKQIKDGQWAIYWDNVPDGYYVLFKYSNLCEVVGNIHENPELLEGRLMDRLMELYDMAEPPMFEMLARGKHSGYEFFIVWCSSHPNAYIKIPEGHPFYKKDYTSIDDKCIVYGGFTFSGEDLDKRYGLPEGWYLGWDYAHSTDFINLPGFCIGGFKCAIKNIETVCKKVIDNIIKEAE